MKNGIYCLMSLMLISFSQIWVVADEEAAVIQPDYRYVFENPDILSFDITYLW